LWGRAGLLGGVGKEEEWGEAVRGLNVTRIACNEDLKRSFFLSEIAVKHFIATSKLLERERERERESETERE
jgi:hypothetical protein